jgi:hypothetical protein
MTFSQLRAQPIQFDGYLVKLIEREVNALALQLQLMRHDALELLLKILRDGLIGQDDVHSLMPLDVWTSSSGGGMTHPR